MSSEDPDWATAESSKIPCFCGQDRRPKKFYTHEGSCPAYFRLQIAAALRQAEQRNLPPKPAGEDDVRYNGGEMVALFHELLGPVEYERFQKAVPWVRSEITQLVHRIYNLRRLNQEAEQRGREQERAELASWIEFYSDDSNGNDEQWRKLAAAIRARGKE